MSTVDPALELAKRLHPDSDDPLFDLARREDALEAILADREQIAAALSACFAPGDDCTTAENVRVLLAVLRGRT